MAANHPGALFCSLLDDLDIKFAARPLVVTNLSANQLAANLFQYLLRKVSCPPLSLAYFRLFVSLTPWRSAML